MFCPSRGRWVEGESLAFNKDDAPPEHVYPKTPLHHSTKILPLSGHGTRTGGAVCLYKTDGQKNLRPGWGAMFCPAGVGGGRRDSGVQQR